MQSGFQAVDNLLRRRPADHVPLHDYPWGDTLRRWAAEGMPTDEHGNAIDCIDHFGFELAGCGGWFKWLPKVGEDQVLAETDEWKVTRNGAGAAFKYWKNKSGTPEHVDFHMSTREIWEKEYRPLVLQFDRERLGKIEDARAQLAKRRAQGKWTYFGHCFIWEFLRASLGDYNMLIALATDPEWIRDFNRVYTDFYKEAYRLLLADAGKPDGIWIYEDLGYRDKLFCSPDILAELIFPFYREMVDFFHSYDLPVVLHSCGYQEPMIPLVVAAGFDALNPMEVKAGNQILKYAEQYGDRLAFVGGLDARILESGDRAVIRKGVTDFVTGLKARGARFVYGSDHSISTNIRYADFQYAIEVYREHCMW